MNAKKVTGVVVSAAVVLIALIGAVQAVGVQLVCIEQGQVLRFSECNAAIPDRVCQTTTCQFCVREAQSGIYCPVSLNECNEGCVYIYRNETQEVELPQITLIAPASNHVEPTARNLSFSFSVTKSSTIGNCSLHVDGVHAALMARRVQSGTNTINHFISPGTHSWRISCVTRTNNTQIISNSRTLTVSGAPVQNATNTTNSTQPPATNTTNTTLPPQNQTNASVILLTPVDAFTASSPLNISFTYNFSASLNTSRIRSCLLIINNALVANTSFPTGAANRSALLFELPFSFGSYSWYVSCRNTTNATFNASARSFTIAQQVEQAPEQNNGGRSGGGGGGGSRLGVAGRANSTNVSTTSVSETNLSQNNDASFESESEETSEEDGLALTGAAIGASINQHRTPIIVVLLVILAVLWVAYYARQQSPPTAK